MIKASKSGKTLTVNGRTIEFEQRVEDLVVLDDRVIIRLYVDDFAVGDPLVGRNLLAYGSERARGRALFGEYLEPKQRPLDAVAKQHPELDRERWLRPLRSVEVDGYKLIWTQGVGGELYHVAEDPGETHDLAASEPERVVALRARLEAGGSLVQTPRRAHAPLGREARRLLEAIGYAEPTEDAAEGEGARALP